MTNIGPLRCDGCGQLASPEHIARRLRRLEWTTRYRPVHIQAVLLGAVSPQEDAEFLYSPSEEFRGEAADLLRAVGISFAGKTAEEVHAEFQSLGLFVTHILECPLEDSDNAVPYAADLLREHLPSAASRIRRSLKPKSVTLVTEMPQEVLQDIAALDLGCPLLLDGGKPFSFSSSTEAMSFSRFRELLAAAGGTERKGRASGLL